MTLKTVNSSAPWHLSLLASHPFCQSPPSTALLCTALGSSSLPCMGGLHTGCSSPGQPSCRVLVSGFDSPGGENSFHDFPRFLYWDVSTHGLWLLPTKIACLCNSSCLYLRHPGISKLGHQPGLLILGGAACIWRPSLGSVGNLHEDSKSVTQTPRQASLSYSGRSHRWPRVWQGLPRLSWADYLPVCHPTVVTVVVTSLLYSSAAAPIPALGLKACCLCKANKPL